MKNLITLDCEQGSEEWHAARLAIPTASQFNRIVTSTGQKGRQASDYLAELYAEHITGQQVEIKQTDDMMRGTELEPQARAMYELETGNDVIEVGGVYLDEHKTVMISPDGLIPELKKGIEIKCPRVKKHIQTIWSNSIPTEYILQVQGALWVTGYETWDFISFCPDFTPQPILIITVQRDEKLIETIDKHIRTFSRTLEAYKNGEAA